MHEELHPSSHVPQLCIPPNKEGRGLIRVKDCVNDENRSVARYAAESTGRLVTTAAEDLNLASYVERLSKKVMLDYKNDKKTLFMGNF